MSLPSDATEESRLRLDLARRLAAACPAELGQEIALTGSAARGVADAFSDVEFNLWVDTMPPGSDRAAWLERMGAVQIRPEDVEDRDGTHWRICRFGDTWVEVGWAEMDRHDELFRSILAAEIDGYFDLTIAWTMQQALPLRTRGWIARWQEALQSYPDALQGRIIRNNTQVWSDPHVPGVRRALAARGQIFALSMRLHWDVMNLLRVLWAINRQWDRSWKGIHEHAQAMPLKPERLADRIDEIFVLADPERSVRTCFQLIAETLALVPLEIDVSSALTNIQTALKDRPVQVPS